MEMDSFEAMASEVLSTLKRLIILGARSLYRSKQKYMLYEMSIA